MKEQIQLLIAQHKIHKEECEIEMNSNYDRAFYDEALFKEIEMRSLFISELEELLSF